MADNIQAIFSNEVNPSSKQDYLNTLFSKYLIPKLGMFREVKEDIYDRFRKTGTTTKARWHDRHNNAFSLKCFNHGPWFLVVYRPNSVEYGKEDDTIKYYEIPQFEQMVDQMVLTERELFG